MQIIHGENIVQSRNYLNKMVEQSRQKGIQIVHLEAKPLTIPLLEDHTASQSLFGESRLIVIEELHSLPKSARKDELIQFLANLPPSAELEIILWEKRSLTPTMIKKLKVSNAQEFKITSALFSWLDSLSGNRHAQTQQNMLKSLAKAIDSDGDFMCHSMLVRQVRLLLQAQQGSFASMAPFMAAKLNKQAQQFSEQQLLTIHHQLLVLDIHQKTSSSKLSLREELELLTVEM